MQRFLLIKAKKDRIAGVASGGGVNSIVSEYKVVVKMGILFILGSNSVHEVNVKGNWGRSMRGKGGKWNTYFMSTQCHSFQYAHRRINTIVVPDGVSVCGRNISQRRNGPLRNSLVSSRNQNTHMPSAFSILLSGHWPMRML